MRRHRTQKKPAAMVRVCAVKTWVSQSQFSANTPTLPAEPSINKLKPGDRDKYIGLPPPFSETEGENGEWPHHGTGEIFSRIHS